MYGRSDGDVVRQWHDIAIALCRVRAACVDHELHVWDAGSHRGFLEVAPEDAERTAEVRRFAERCGSERQEVGR